MLRLLRYVSLRHFLATPLRTSLTIVGIAVGVAVTVAIAAVNRSVLEAFRSTVDTVSGKADLSVSSGPAGFPEELLEKVRGVDGVFKAAGALSMVARMPGEKGDSLYLLGVDLGDDGYFREYRNAGEGPDIGDPLSFLNSPDAVLVSERFAKDHGKKVGDTFPILTASGAQEFTIRGLLKEEGPVRAFGGSFGVMDVFAAQAAFNKDRKLDRIDVAVVKGRDPDEVASRISAALGGGYDVERPSRRGQSVQNMIKSFQLSLNLGSAVALLVGIFLVYNTVSISVVQRRREIGTLRALGTSGNAIRTLFACEAAMLGALGTLVGIPFGKVVAQGALSGVTETISSIYVQVNAARSDLKPQDVVLGALLGIAGSIFAALRPASHAAKVQPVEALRRDVSAGMGPVTLGSAPTLLGFGLLLATVPLSLLPAPVENLPVGGFLALFCVLMGASLLSPLLLRHSHRLFLGPATALAGISGRLAADNFARAPARTAVPVSALAVGVAMTVCMAGYVGSFKAAADKWIDQSVPADIFVTASYQFAGVRNTPMGPALGLELEKLQGVKDVDRIRIAKIDYQSLSIMLLSLEPATYFQRGKLTFLKGNPAEAQARVTAGELLVSENLARRRHINVGDVLELKTPTGLKKYPVAGVIIDYTSDQGLISMSRETYRRDYHDDQVDTYELYLHDINDLERVRKEVLARWGKQYDLFALSNAELRAQTKKLLDEAFAITYAMELVAVLLALLGVINTLLAAVLDRTRELGLLRAVGATRGQVMAAIACEAGMMGIAGGLIGVLSGTAMAYLIVISVGQEQTGWSFPLVLPLALAAQMAVASAIAAVLAGLYPAWRAAKLDVVEALSYE